MGCGAKEESEKNSKEKKRERGRGGNAQFPRSHPYSSPSFFFFLLTSLCAVPTIWTPGAGYLNCGQKRFSSFHRISIHKNVSITLLRISLKPHTIAVLVSILTKNVTLTLLHFYFFDLLHPCNNCHFKSLLGSFTIKGRSVGYFSEDLGRAPPQIFFDKLLGHTRRMSCFIVSRCGWAWWMCFRGYITSTSWQRGMSFRTVASMKRKCEREWLAWEKQNIFPFLSTGFWPSAASSSLISSWQVLSLWLWVM